MKIIKNLIDIDLKHNDHKHLLINGNNGLADLVSPEEYRFIAKWNTGNCLSLAESENPLLYSKLLEREYIVSDAYDEDDIRMTICKAIKQRNKIKTEKFCRVHFLLTYACNFACPYCYEQHHRSNSTLSFEQVDRIFEIHNHKLSDIGFFGGEPLLPGNRDVIKYIISKAPDATYSITTNGYYLKDYIDILKHINIVSLQITLDGNREQHDRTRMLANGNGTFDTTIESIKLSLQQGFPTTVRMNATIDNIQACLETKKYIENQNWGNRNLWFNIQPVFQLTHNEHKQLYSKLFIDDVTAVNKNTILKHLPPISNFLYNNVPLRPVIKACDAECYYRFYDPEGNIYSCIASVGDKRKRIGTYWPTLLYEENSFLTRDITTIPKCKTCKYALLCGGGCANAINPENSIMETPNCYTMMYDISVTIPEVYKLKKEGKI